MRRTPVRARPAYPALRTVKGYARRVHRLPSAQVDAFSKTPDDYEQDLHLKLLEVYLSDPSRSREYMHRTLQNEVRDLRRRQRPPLPLHLEVIGEAELPYDETDQDNVLEARYCLRVLEKALSPEQCSLLRDVACSGESWASLASERGVSRATLGHQIRNARKSARVALSV